MTEWLGSTVSSVKSRALPVSGATSDVRIAAPPVAKSARIGEVVRRDSGFLAPPDISRIRNVRQVSLAALAQTGRETDGARCRDGSPMRCCPRSVRGCRWDCRNANAGARYGRRVAGRPDHVDVLGVPLDQRCVGDDRHGLDGSERRRVLAPRRSRAVPHRRRGSRCSCTTPGWSSRPSGFRRPPRPTSRRTGAISTCGCRFGSKPARPNTPG
jgi:hypothetical protein